MEEYRKVSDERERTKLTPAAEEYLEMIYRLSFEDDAGKGEIKPVRICTLAEKLHVSPSSASRMAQSMALWGYIDFRRYGYITMTDKGRETGGFFVKRRDTVGRFFEWLCGGKCEDDTDKIAHYLSEDTVSAMEKRMRPPKTKKTAVPPDNPEEQQNRNCSEDT